MTREQKLEQELAGLRKAKNILTDRLDDAGKKSVEEKAKLYDDVYPLIRTWLEAHITERGDITAPDRVIVSKVMEAVLGADRNEYLEKL